MRTKKTARAVEKKMAELRTHIDLTAARLEQAQAAQTSFAMAIAEQRLMPPGRAVDIRLAALQAELAWSIRDLAPAIKAHRAARFDYELHFDALS